MKINVTKKCIQFGEPKSSDCCPVALAIRQALPHHFVSVCPRLWINRKPVLTPDSVVSFVEAFDDGKPVQPFIFELPL